MNARGSQRAIAVWPIVCFTGVAETQAIAAGVTTGRAA